MSDNIKIRLPRAICQLCLGEGTAEDDSGAGDCCLCKGSCFYGYLISESQITKVIEALEKYTDHGTYFIIPRPNIYGELYKEWCIWPKWLDDKPPYFKAKEALDLINGVKK